jgi:coenzyme F420-dependent glucose-6-phosphate dehydrogenase
MTKFYWFLGHEQFQPEQLVEQARLVESAGFDGVMVSEHLQPWVDDAGAGGFAFSTLGAIAVKTSSIKLMTGVVTPLFRYHPAVVAQAAATIDRLSGGRFELGIGTGENLNEAPLGVVFPDYKERSARIKEAITILRGLLSGDSVTFKGAYYTVDDLKLYSPPLAHVPILLAAGGPKSAELAVELCDGIITSVKDVREAQETIVDPVRRLNEDFRLVASRWSIFAQNETDAWQALRPWRGLRAPHRATISKPLELQNEADGLPKDEIMSKYSLLRGVDDIVAAYEPLVKDLKADTVCFQMTSMSQAKTITMVGNEVLPRLRKL